MKKQPGCYGHIYKIDTMKYYQNIAALFLRISIATGFLSASADRFGWWGINGAKGVSWGDWQHFVNYTNVLLPFAPPALANVLLPFAPPALANVFAIAATVAEIVIAILLAIGLYTRLAAFSAGLLALFFALSMTFTLGIKAPFSYSVFIVSAAGFLLAAIPAYKWSIDITRLKKTI
jgi:putative oxidoreductase